MNQFQGLLGNPGFLNGFAERLQRLHGFSDFEGLMNVLDPDLVVHIDPAAARPGAPTEIHGAEAWAKGAVVFAQAFADLARSTTPALIDGNLGLISAPGGRLLRALNLRIKNGKVTEIEIIADPTRLDHLALSVLKTR